MFHTSDTVVDETRLIDMAIEPILIASSAFGILVQRLARNLFDRCKKQYAAILELLTSLNIVFGYDDVLLR